MSRSQKLLLLVLADYHDTRRKLAWPSVLTLAEECLSSLASTKRDLAYLEEHYSLVRSRTGLGRGSNYTYKFVGLDLSLQEAVEIAQAKEGVHGEPFFSTGQRGADGVQKGFKTAPEKGSEGVQGERRYKEEPEPSTKTTNQEGADRAAMPYFTRAEKFGASCPIPTAKFLREVADRRQALTGMRDYDEAFKRLVLAVAEECRIPPPIAMAMWGYDERECAAVDQARAG